MAILNLLLSVALLAVSVTLIVVSRKAMKIARDLPREAEEPERGGR